METPTIHTEVARFSNGEVAGYRVWCTVPEAACYDAAAIAASLNKMKPEFETLVGSSPILPAWGAASQTTEKQMLRNEAVASITAIIDYAAKKKQEADAREAFKNEWEKQHNG